MSQSNEEVRAALKTLDELTASADLVRGNGDSGELGSYLKSAAEALETLRRHHAAMGEPVSEHVLNGNGH